MSSQGPEHLLDTFLLLLHVGMDVEVEGGAYVGMSQQDADCLVITSALDASRGETMA